MCIYIYIYIICYRKHNVINYITCARPVLTNQTTIEFQSNWMRSKEAPPPIIYIYICMYKVVIIGLISSYYRPIIYIIEGIGPLLTIHDDF